jgi:hypothetical protein
MCVRDVFRLSQQLNDDDVILFLSNLHFHIHPSLLVHYQHTTMLTQPISHHAEDIFQDASAALFGTEGILDIPSEVRYGPVTSRIVAVYSPSLSLRPVRTDARTYHTAGQRWESGDCTCRSDIQQWPGEC